MKRGLLISLILTLLLPVLSYGQSGNPQRQKWFSEIRNYKHDFLAKELSLTKEQQSAFFPLYDAMEDEINKINRETRELEKKILDSSSPTDTEYEAAAKPQIELKGKESDIELKYFSKFKEILTAKQLFQMKNAERMFTRKIMSEHNRRSQAKGQKRK